MLNKNINDVYVIDATILYIEEKDKNSNENNSKNMSSNNSN